jgi:hypothetical protein
MIHMGLPVPRWSPIVVTDEFIDRYPETWFQGSDDTASRPDPGLHFGSCLSATNPSRDIQRHPENQMKRQ